MACGVSVLLRGHSEDGSPGVSWSPRNALGLFTRMGRNPATGEAIQIKASKKVAFRATKELKMAI